MNEGEGKKKMERELHVVTGIKDFLLLGVLAAQLGRIVKWVAEMSYNLYYGFCRFLGIGFYILRWECTWAV